MSLQSKVTAGHLQRATSLTALAAACLNTLILSYQQY